MRIAVFHNKKYGALQPNNALLLRIQIKPVVLSKGTNGVTSSALKLMPSVAQLTNKFVMTTVLNNAKLNAAQNQLKLIAFLLMLASLT
jgi:hypothetical protein